VQANLREVDAPDRIVRATLEAFGPQIDILVNNAGVLFSKSLRETTADDFAAIFDVNVRAPLLMAKAVEPHLRAPGRINISSVGARQGFESLAMYSSSKAAIEGLTRGLAAELGHVGHTVNAVAPGPVVSEMLDDVPQDIVDIQLKTTPVEHRHGTV
jgi:3-oxoacyl-[acyl-carrier protein] reductase